MLLSVFCNRLRFRLHIKCYKTGGHWWVWFVNFWVPNPDSLSKKINCYL